MPSLPKTEEERLRYRILELDTGERHSKKVERAKPTKNADIVKALRIHFLFHLLLKLNAKVGG